MGRYSSSSTTTWRRRFLLLPLFLLFLISSADASADLQVQEETEAEIEMEMMLHKEEDAISVDLNLDVVSSSSSSCASISNCTDCSNTYTCHWCEADNACHAKGSRYGCAFGVKSCGKVQPDDTNNSTTCASHTTCADCALASHLCHWCEHDNACHAVGSRYGCKVGVDCYSNDRCRRSAPEPLKPSNVEAIGSVPLVLILFLGASILGCISCCFCCVREVEGAYDDLATITLAAASLPPLSVIGGGASAGANLRSEPFYSALESYPEEEQQEDADADADVGEEERRRGQATTTRSTSEEYPERDPEAPDTSPLPQEGEIRTATSSNENETAGNNVADASTPLLSDHQGQQEEDARTTDNDDPSHPQPQPQEDSFALINDEEARPRRQEMARSSFFFAGSHYNNNNLSSSEPPSPGVHMRRLSCMCSACYYTTVLIILSLCAASIYLFPRQPVYNVCNDAVAWRKIITNIAAFRLDASFEILISLSNPNHIGAALEKGTGSFTFQGQPIGTFEIPPVMCAPMAITDLMLIAHVTPDKLQAFQIAEAYYLGKLVLEAEFVGTIRVPSLNNVEFEYERDGIQVNVNELSDRSLCHCPSWDDNPKGGGGSEAAIPQFMFELN